MIYQYVSQNISFLPSLKAKLLSPVWDGIPCIWIKVKVSYYFSDTYFVDINFKEMLCTNVFMSTLSIFFVYEKLLQNKCASGITLNAIFVHRKVQPRLTYINNIMKNIFVKKCWGNLLNTSIVKQVWSLKTCRSYFMIIWENF